ncbi:MAG: MFS transporter [Opitutaceae bacterium]|jgi:ACS family hexuronate transporter-like MFS transporter|nr:MFS transporter [Opitutaceae bacterium]
MTQLLPKTRALLADATFRWFVLALLFCVSFLNYLDRTTLSVLQETLIAEPTLGLDQSRYGDIVNAFLLCYAGALMLSGWVVDKIGPRAALLIFAGLWSVATIGCGLAHGFAMLFVFRALLGVAEPGLAPVSIRVATAWAPRHNRGLYMNLCSVGGSVGNIATASIVVWLTATAGTWRHAFVLPGLAGLLIAAVWWLSYRDPAPAAPAASDAGASPDLTRLNSTHVEKNAAPAAGTAASTATHAAGTAAPTAGSATAAADAPAAAAAAVAVAPPLPWTRLWGTRALWGIVLARLVSDPVWNFILYWLPGYLEKQQAVAFGSLGVVGFIFLASFIGGLGASVLSDIFAKRHRRDPLLGRKNLLYLVSIAAPLCIAIPHLRDVSFALPLLGVVSIKGLALVIVAFCVIAAVCMSWMSGLAPIIAEIFPMGNVASVWGIAGTFGAAGTIGFNLLLKRAGQPGFPFTLGQMFLAMGFMHLASAVILFVLVRRPKNKLAIKN